MSLPLTTFLWVLWGAGVGVFLGASWILHYHWSSYSRDDRGIRKARRWYYGVSGVVLVLAAISIMAL